VFIINLLTTELVISINFLIITFCKWS